MGDGKELIQEGKYLHGEPKRDNKAADLHGWGLMRKMAKELGAVT